MKKGKFVLQGTVPELIHKANGKAVSYTHLMRCNYNTYIICLTALDQEMDQVMGYEAGADDYITKPFSPVSYTHLFIQSKITYPSQFPHLPTFK